MKQLFFIFIGGGFGSVLRFAMGNWLNNSTSTIPYSTFLINVLGSLLIGIILGLSFKHDGLNNNQTLLLATGFCGGFTTFSAFAYENHLFLKSGDIMNFAIYTFGSIIFGLLAVFLGMYLVK